MKKGKLNSKIDWPSVEVQREFQKLPFIHTILMGPCSIHPFGSGALQGDSGGPVLYNNTDENRLQILGVIAAGDLLLV